MRLKSTLNWNTLFVDLNGSMEEDKETFLDRHGDDCFKYSEELMEGLEAGTWDLASYTGGQKNRMQAKNFVEIYGKKAQQLNQADDDYLKQLQNDLIDFCKNMNVLNDEIIDIWSFCNQHWYISVFVARSTKKVVASLKTKS